MKNKNICNLIINIKISNATKKTKEIRITWWLIHENDSIRTGQQP